MIEEKRITATVKDIFDRIEFTAEPAGLYDPLRYMISIGGKRIRPALCLTAYSMYHDSFSPEVLSCAAALEVFHTFTLIHDDIMDRSPLRRGVPTVWTKWNSDTAILSGDVMVIDAFRRMNEAPAESRPQIMEVFLKTSAQVCEGQQLDMEFESRDEVSMAEYLDMIGLKTAVLLACSAKTGALAAGAPEADCEAIYEYGYRLGLAFQIADDYLDAYGDEKVFGKPIGGDIMNRKKSWLTIRALEKAADRESFMSAFKAGDVAAVKSLYDTLGVPGDARAEILSLSNAATDALSPLHCDITPLRIFAEKLIGRAK